MGIKLGENMVNPTHWANVSLQPLEAVFIQSSCEKEELKESCTEQGCTDSTLTIPSSSLLCFRCFKNLSLNRVIYNQCCFQTVCERCNQIYKRCIPCNAALGDIMIPFGSHPMSKHSSQLRLLKDENKVELIIRPIEQHFPATKAQLRRPVTMNQLNSNGQWYAIDENKHEITSTRQYYLSHMRVPHDPLTDAEVDRWIIALLTSGPYLTKNSLTHKEFHRVCNIYAAPINFSPLSQEYIQKRLQNLVDRHYCELDEQTNTYRYIG